MGIDFKKCIALKYVFILVLTFILGCAQGRRLRPFEFSENSVISQSNNQTERDSKLLPFLAFVTFSQGLCKVDGADAGVCMKKSACTKLGGKDNDGNCAQGFHKFTCCTITQKCGDDPVTVTTNGTQLLPDATFHELCRYEIPKQPGVCQIRLDFTTFMIATDQTALTGDCDVDTLTISGQTNTANLGPLCGTLSGQHMYLDYGSNDKINLDIYMMMAASQSWNIMVTMIKCDSLLKAPAGCLQYYTDQRATVKSFNYAQTTGTGAQLNNEDYSVCVRTNPGMKKITWKQCTTNGDVFQVSGDTVAAPNIPEMGDVCVNDWVAVYGDTKHCGTAFNDVTTTAQPFLMQVHFNEWELPPSQDANGDPQPDFTNAGFCLMYAQSP